MKILSASVVHALCVFSLMGFVSLASASPSGATPGSPGIPGTCANPAACGPGTPTPMPMQGNGPGMHSLPASSLIFPAFTEEAYGKASREGRPILLVFSKSDCPGCRMQAPNLQQVLAEPEIQALGLVVQQVDVIQRRELAERFRVMGWTVLSIERGGREIARLPRLYQADEIRQFLRKALVMPVPQGNMPPQGQGQGQGQGPRPAPPSAQPQPQPQSQPSVRLPNTP